MSAVSIRDIIAPHFWNTFNSKKPHQIYAGGRASTKTSQIAIKIDEFNLEYTECNAIIIKRYQNTIRNSVFKEIKRALKRLGLQEDVDYKAIPMHLLNSYPLFHQIFLPLYLYNNQ